MPGFNMDTFPFIVSYAKYDKYDWSSPLKSDTIDLINLKTGRIDPLIQGSASNLRE